MPDKYILDDAGKPKIETDLMKWARWYEENDLTVARTLLSGTGIDIMISTVFLGLDHSFGRGVPILFETSVHGGAFDRECDRYPSRQAADAGHDRLVELSKSELDGEYQTEEIRP